MNLTPHMVCVVVMRTARVLIELHVLSLLLQIIQDALFCMDMYMFIYLCLVLVNSEGRRLNTDAPRALYQSCECRIEINYRYVRFALPFSKYFFSLANTKRVKQTSKYA